jgi:hypothetical protein
MEQGKSTKRKGKRQPKGESHFLNIPWIVLDSPAYLDLSLSARAMLVELVRQFNGRNNGRIHAARKYMRGRGWNSNDTIQRNINELLRAGLIVQTRTGGLNAGPHLYAITFRQISDFSNLDIRTSAYGKWQEKNARSRPITGHGKPDHQASRRTWGHDTSPAIGPEKVGVGKTAGPAIGHNVDIYHGVVDISVGVQSA